MRTILAIDFEKNAASPASTIQAKFFKGGAEGLVSMDGRFESKPSPTILNGTADETSGHSGGPEPIAHMKRNGLVRRLTPLECARLQSMPDDFKWPEKISKTAMYKIVGNGQASLMVWHLRQAIQKSDPSVETVIDLFCGGGVGAVGLHGRFWEYKK